MTSPLVNVSQFKRRCLELSDDQPDEELTHAQVDLSSDDVKIISKFDQIEREIKKELEGTEEVIDIAPSDAIRTNAAKNLLTMKNAPIDFPRPKKHVVNYLTPNMQELPLDLPHDPPVNEVILTVAFFSKTRQKLQEYEVLGSQLLTALRDRLYCLTDHIADGPETKGGYFFIENTFYNDLRSDTALDYSANVIGWVNEQQRYLQPGLGVYTSRSMADTTFEDLSVRIGVEYMYMHQGNCGHPIVFTDIRMSCDQDRRNRAYYPLHVFQTKIRRKKCLICEIYPAKFVTYGDKMMPDNPCFYCDQCYRPFHYSADGKLLYDDFEVYPFFHDFE